MGYKFSKKYEINYQDVDYQLRGKLPSIVNFFCDVGTTQSEELGEDINTLKEKGYAWVFYKYDINMYTYPKYRETINIETEAVGFNRFYAYRRYKIISSSGEIYGEAMALFFLINIERRRPMRISNEQLKMYGCVNENNINIDMDEVQELERVDFCKKFNIRYSDIDSNGHVNNANYFEWAIESVPVDIVKNHSIKNIKVVFEKETTYGNSILVNTQIEKKGNNIISIHRILAEDEKQITKLEINWA